MIGWIKLHRKLIDWEWYHNSQMVHLFIHLMLKANHSGRLWQGLEVKEGQLITGREKLSTETGISIPVLRKCLNRLKKSGEILIKSTNKFSIITICNYEYYQNRNYELDQLQIHLKTNRKPTKNHQNTTNNNKEKDIEELKEKDYSDEILEFYNEILPLFPEKTRPKEVAQRKGWLEVIDQLKNIHKYDLIELKGIIQHFRRDSFWASNFLSLNKLLKKNKDGVLYVEYFSEALKGNSLRHKVEACNYEKTLKNPKRMSFY